jgi:glycosyltransferase involved in cell wall biosynthesis
LPTESVGSATLRSLPSRFLKEGNPQVRIGIDAHCLGQGKTGNETYTYNLVKNLSLLEPDGIDYLIYLTSRGESESGCLTGPGFRTKRIRPENPFIRIPISFAIESRTESLNLLHAQYFLPHHLNCQTVLTVHDVLYERFPHFFTKADYYRNKIGIPWSCRRADHIITVSESSKQDLMSFYGLRPERITVTYHGADACYRPIDKEESKERLRKYGIREDFILYVGTIQPRKNIPRLLSAFAQLKQKKKLPHKLVIVGPKAWLVEETSRALRDHPAKDDIIVTGYVPRYDLPYFYNAATVFAYVSIAEGFGLPVLEAMACGVPTVTSRGSALEEIAGGAAALVDPLDDVAIASTILDLLLDADRRANLRALGLQRSAQFTYRKMALQTQAIYHQLLA